MILTEEEAKTKRCQESFGDGNISQHGHAFASQVMQGGAYAVHTSPSFCIGSACMAWRIHAPAEPPSMDFTCTKGERQLPTHGDPGSWTFEEGDKQGSSWSRPNPGKPATGYCGKAGRP